MMRKFVVRFLMLLCVLGMSINTAWAGLSIGEPTDWYYVNFETRISTPTCGSNPGQVKLNYTDNQGNQDNPWITGAKPANPYDNETYSSDAYEAWHLGLKDAIWDKKSSNAKYTTKGNLISDEESELHQYETTVYKDGYDAGWNWYGTYYKGLEATDAQKDTMMMHFPVSPYDASANEWWSDAFNYGAKVAKGEETAMTKSDYSQTTSWNDTIHYPAPAWENGWAYNYRYDIPNPYYQTYSWAGYTAGYNWCAAGHYLNTLTGETEDDYQTAWGASANLNGYAMVHMPDLDLEQISSYAYFEAKVRENDGWYFAGWSYKEGDTDLGGAVDTDTPEDKGKLFKIYPSDLQGWSNESKVYAYATFKPVMVSNYKVNGLINGTGNSTTIVFDAVGERVGTTDFTVSADDANFSVEITSCADNKVTVTVTYSGSADGEFRGNVTLASQSGCSQLTAAVYARVGATSEEEASLYNNKVLEENLYKSGDLTTLIGEATSTQIVALNNNYTTLNVDRDVTIFTNGYRITSLNVTNGTVTMVYDKYEGGADAVSVTGGKLILNGGIYGTLTIGANGEVEQNGANFTGAATNNGTLTTNEGVFNAGLTSSKTLTVNMGTFKGETAVTVSGGTATINRGSIEGTTCGLRVTGGTATIKKLAAIKGGTNSVLAAGGTVNVECGKFDGLLSTVASFTSGYFKIKADAANVEEGKEWMQLTDGVEYNEGYRFFLGDSETAKTYGVGVCRIGDVSYAKLEDALAYANNNPNTELVIFMTNNYTLPAGYYTLPAKATLVVPMSDTQQKTNLTAPRLVSNDVQNADEDKYINNIPYEFRRLTFATGVNMDVIGKIEMTCTQYSSNEAYTSQPVGAYGHLVLEEGSHLTLQSGSEVRAWGFVTGKGEMDARRGSVVREMFQMGDWKGAMTSVAITGMVGGTDLENVVKGVLGAESGDFSDKKIFPVSQYFIQNIESPVKYHPGALLSTSAAVSEGVYGMSLSMAATDIAVVGVSNVHTAIFLMDQQADAENTWVRKWYDVENDIQVYDINSGAHIGSMELDMGGVNLLGASIPVRLNSAMFDLPITSNFKIHLLSGTMDFEQNTSLLPGSEVEVDKESTVTISMSAADMQAKANSTPGHVYHTGAVYVYDANEWDTYAYNNAYTKIVRYTPSAGGQPTNRSEGTRPASAKINVHGTFNTADGFVYTTESGANIFSNNEDAGTFIFNNAGEDAGEREVWQIKGNGTKNSHYTATTFTCAQLKNKDNSYTATEDAIAGFAFLYRDDKWQEPMTQTGTDMILTYNFDCFAADVSMMTYLGQICDMDYENPMASPLKNEVKNIYAPLRIREYLIADAFAKANDFESGILPHEYEYFRAMYYTAVAALGKDAGEAYMINQMQNSGNPTQVAAAGLVPLIPGFKTQAEAYSGSYDLGPAIQKLYIKPQEWVEVAGTVHILLGVDEEVTEDIGDSYAAALAAVQNNNYSACDDIVEEYLDYIESQKMNPYLTGVDGNADHTYSDAAGAGRLFILMADGSCQWWEVEKKDNLYHCIHPQNDTYYYWDDDEGEWLEKKYTITWKNWNDAPVYTADLDGNETDTYEVTYGTMAEFLGTNPTREANIDYTYDFTGWTPALGPVTSDVTYTATFTQKERKYTIIFKQEGGVEIERQFLKHNDVPVCENTPTKVGHTLVWSPAIAAVTGDATYTATWLENPPTEYEVTFYDYDGTTKLKPTGEDPYMVAVGALPTPPADPAGKPATSEYNYVFDHWAPALEAVSATSAKSYTAVYREEAVTYMVRFFQEDGETQIGDDQKLAYGAVPAIPTAGIIEPGEAGYTYTYVWENMMDDTKTVEAVKANADYKPRFTGEKIKYTVKLKSNPSEACTFTGAGIYKHGDAITISQTAKPNYTFQNWTDENGQVVNALPTTVTADIDLTANFTFEGIGHTITWKNWNDTILASGSQKENTATTYVGATPTREASESTTYMFYGWTAASDSKTYKNGLTPKATKNETYTAYFNEIVRKYTISWKNEAGTADIEVDYEQPYGATIEYNSATPTKNADADYSYTFDGWSATQGGAVVALPATVSGDAAFYAHFSATPVLPTNLILGAAGSADLASAEVKKNDLVITSNGINSAELKGADNLTLTGEAIFRLEKNFAAQTWYAVAVPWTVTLSGIRDKNGNAFAANSVYVLEFDANAYASADRQSGRSDYWKFLDLNGHDMYPGKLYMIWFRSAQTAVQFYKKAGETIWNTEISVTTTGGSGDQANWNAIANPALYHANLSTGAEDVLKYNGSDSYVLGTTTNMIVGEPVFVQVETPNSVTADVATGAAPAPYRRAPQENTVNNRFVLELSLAGNLADRMIVQTAEEKLDTYVIGKDLAKMGVSAQNAQMWINRYDAQLCKNTVALLGESVEYPLHIAAPQAGGYVLSASQKRGDASLYLTYNGEAIWNLSESDYVLQLEQGTTANYGLRISVRKAPEVATGIDEAVVDAQGDIRKRLINNQVFIIRGEKVYTIDGQLVK